MLQSPAARELADAENFSLRANAVTREVIAAIEVEDGVCLELSIKLPASWPLEMAEVECRRQVLSLSLPCLCTCTLYYVCSDIRSLSEKTSVKRAL